jgi:polyhydroxybutyrate depolymerase
MFDSRAHRFAALASLSLLIACDPSAPDLDASVSDVPVPDAAMSDAAVSDAPGDDASDLDAPISGDGIPSAGCSATTTLTPGATTELTVMHDGLERTFRVHLPTGYDGSAPAPLVLMFHGGGGSGRQLEERSADMNPIADREGFVAVYPDGTGIVRTWNGGGCCGPAVTNDVDDVGFVSAMLDRIDAELCVDRSRFYASGMSNGGILSHRLACEIPERFAAIAPVAGAEMAPSCAPSASVPLMHIHGSLDGHVPPPGGDGCGPAGVPFPPLADTMETRRTVNGCDASTEEAFVEGDGTCIRYTGCDADVVRCLIEGGGHNWPGGQPPAGLADCPEDGGQSTTFVASEVIWRFFSEHQRL